MNTTDLTTTLEQVRPPAIEPGVHMGVLESQLRGRFAHPYRAMLSRHHRWAWVAILVVIVAGLGFAAAPFVSRITWFSKWAWQDSGGRFIALNQVGPEHRSELADKWERGEGVLVKKVEGKVTKYRVKFTFADGTSTEVWTYGPPDPVQRRELERLIATGSGEVVETKRNEQSGYLLYLNRYTLSNSEVVTMIDGFPPMSDGDRDAAQSFIDNQVQQGAGVVVGQTEDWYVVEYQLPDGRPFTSFTSTPPARLTPEREQEIHAMQSAGEGRLIQRGIGSDGWAYLVEYQLSDGTVFRIGNVHPPMPAAEWTSVSKELVVKLGAEEYIEETVTGTDGQPVAVLTVELSNGMTFQIPKEMRTLVLNGYLGQ